MAEGGYSGCDTKVLSDMLQGQGTSCGTLILYDAWADALAEGHFQTTLSSQSSEDTVLLRGSRC